MESLVTPTAVKDFYRQKKVFVTGHTGFKGAWLITWLSRLDAVIKGYALAPESCRGIYSVVAPQLRHESIIDDIRDKQKLQKEILNFKPDIIFHLAAQPLVRKSYDLPSETFEVNAVGTANLLEAVRNLNNRCVIIVITTDKVYENKESGQAYKESDRLGGYDPYSASKACTEIVVDSFRSSFFNLAKFEEHKKSLVSVRAGNVIGGGDYSEDRIIPDIIKSLEKNVEIPVRNPSSIRPWQHVLEPVSGYIQLAAAVYQNPQEYSPAYNFGPLLNDHLPVKDLAEIAINHWGSGSWADKSNRDAVHEAGILKLDISLAKKELGWIPKLDSQKAISWTIDWYRQAEENKFQYTISQIENYQSI